MGRVGLILASVALVASAGSVFGAEPIAGVPVKIEGDIYAAADISAVVAAGTYLVIASDEKSSVQVLQEVERGKSYRTSAPVNLADKELLALAEGDKLELDLEGIAIVERTLYVLGSHSRKRSVVKKSDEGRPYSKNRGRMAKTHEEFARNWLFRFSLDERGRIDDKSISRISLRNAILTDPVLDRFWTIPGKENGIDFEGITARGKLLYAGFRSPVLRKNWVPVLVFSYGESPRTLTRFVHLGGLGVRGMETVEDGLLLLAGPAGDAGGEFRIYLWNGEDMLPGTGGPSAELVCLAKIRPFPKSKPESIALIGTSDSSWDVLIAFDGAEEQNRILGRFEIPRQPGSAACK